jgi:hypothetical protein
MSLKTKFAFLLILFYGLQINSNGQTITFKILKHMVASREYKDSMVNSFKFIRGAHIPAAIYGTESEYYMTPDSSKTIVFFYKDSVIGCILWTKNLNFLQKIISDGQIDGFARASGVTRSPKSIAYTKGNYLLVFTNYDEKIMSNVSLTKNYQALNISLKPN